MNEKPRGQNTEMLLGRVRLNALFQSLDFNKWVFDGLEVAEDASVLELCCGTGDQTTIFLEKLGRDGHITSVDASEKSLEKIKAGLGEDDKIRLRLLHCDMDNLASEVLAKEAQKFDIVFCSYGLYYSKATGDLLDGLKQYLKPGGKMVVVGPFGPNNEQLFALVERAGARIAPDVLHSSKTYMYEEVIPWASVNFVRVSLRTIHNDVVWEKQKDVLEYWKNTTFFNETLMDAFSQLVSREFSEKGVFLNRKWIMTMVAEDAR